MTTGGGRFCGILGNAARFTINRQKTWYRMWVAFMLMMTFFSVWITPIEFAFLKKLWKHIVYFDYVELLFLADVILQYFVARNYNRQILGYIRVCWPYIMACVPWMHIYYHYEENQVLRFLVLWRMVRLLKLIELFPTKAMKMLAVSIIASHIGGCLFFYSAIILPSKKDGHTWIGSLTLGNKSYANYRDMPFLELYIPSIYLGCAIVTTIGFGDIHPVNVIEMILAIILAFSVSYLIAHICNPEEKNSDVKGDRVFISVQEYQRLRCFMDRSQQPIHETQQSFKGRSKTRKHVAKVKKVVRVAKVKKVVQFDDMHEPQPLIHDVTATNEFGQTQLHITAFEGDVDMARELIASGFDVHAMDNNNSTPLLEAYKGKNAEMISFLKMNGATLMIGDVASYLCSVISSGDVEHFQWLLDNGMNPHEIIKNRTTLFNAAEKGNKLAMLRKLLKRVKTEKSDGTTSYDNGAISGITDQLESLKSTTHQEDAEGDAKKSADKEPRQSKVFADLYNEGDTEALSFTYSYGYAEQKIGFNFWQKLYCDNHTNECTRGWLDEDHIDIWGHMLLQAEQRKSYTVMPVQFMILYTADILVDTWVSLARGLYAPYRPWSAVDLVLLPINYKDQHWVMACLELKNWHLTVYDSSILETHQTWIKELVDKFDMNGFLDSISYWETSGRNRTRVNVNVQIAQDAPQQKNGRDCGVFVCRWLEAFASGKKFKLEYERDEEINVYFMMYRAKIGDDIWAQLQLRLP